MAIEISGIPESEHDVEVLATRVFFKAIDLLGGLGKLAEHRALTWLASLARASYAIVLKEEYWKTEDDIAKRLGLTRNSVRLILRADPNLAVEKVEHPEAFGPSLHIHTAGGIAKLAYRLVKEGQEAAILLDFCREMSAHALQVGEAPWATMVLKRTKGLSYPITSPEPLKERLSGLKVFGVPLEEILDHLDYPIKNPAALLHAIKEYGMFRG
ncbi:MAG: bacterio-opsin activator [Gammaproteobacteria bacterium]|nr:MAG: bacterio-opsin activator [Gammaproteobacteria bacterium]